MHEYLQRILIPGLNSLVRKTVQRSDTGANYNEALNEFMATPTWVDMAIHASMEAVDKHLPEGFMTVGYSIEVIHEAPTCLGMTVTVQATLKEINENRLIFELKAWDEIGDVGRGTHERIVVNKEALLKKAKERWQYMVKRSF
jgi:fluoroacetyl-CoA thioesterase